MKRIFTFAIIGILCISMFVMLIPKARGQETAVSFSFQGNFSGSITNGVFSITSGTVSVGSNMYSVINTPPSDYPSSQSFNQFLTATSGDLDAGCISLTNNYVMGLAALYTQTDSASLSVSFGGGSGFSGTTAITIGFDGPLLTCIIASGNLQVSGSTFTLSASTSGTEPVQSSTSVSVSPNPVYAASPVTCTATVSVSNPTGTITWSTSSSTGTFSSTQTTLTSGTSTTTYTDTSPGTVSITATYSGDSVNSPSSGETGLTISLTPKTQPIEILDYVPITITNAQNSPMPAPFQQIVHVNSAAYSQLEAPNLQNIEFFDSSGNIIPSWFESGNSNSATDTIYWLLLANGIPAHSSVTVYMGFASQTVNLLNPQTTGEAPQLSPIYGQYDDGAHVFNFYDNFAGSSLSNKWNANLGTGSYQVNNGLTISFGGGYLVSSTTFGPGTAFDADITSISDCNNVGYFNLNQPLLPYLYQNNFPGYSGTFIRLAGGNTYPDQWNANNGEANPCGNVYGYIVNSEGVISGVYSVEVLDSTSSIQSLNYATGNSQLPLETNYPASVGFSAAGGTMAVQWARVRTVSPTGIMPTTTIGTLTQFNGNDFPMPEYALGSLLSLIACLAAFTVYIAFKSGFVVPTLGKCIKENCKIWTGD